MMANGADWRSTMARSGLTAKGALYATVGLLAIQVATGDAAAESASRRGAIEFIAGQPFGQLLLGLLTAGLFALAIWQFILMVAGDPVEGSEPKDRVKYAAKAVIYAGTATTALAILGMHFGWWGAGTFGSGGGEASQDQATGTVMSLPGGPWLVALGGVAVLGFALAQLVQHTWRRRFMSRLDRARMTDEVEAGVERAGRAGYAARAAVLAIVGVFLVVAAIQHDPREAVGLSGALQALAQQPWGQGALWAVAIGLFLYGCFCFAEARYRRAM